MHAHRHMEQFNRSDKSFSNSILRACLRINLPQISG